MTVNTTAAPAITGPSAGSRMAALACLLVVGSLLGLSLVIAKMAVLAGAAPLAFLSLSMLAAGLVLLGGEWIAGRIRRIDRRVIEYGLLSGALFAAPNAVAFLAVRHVGAGFLSLTFAFPILFTYLLSLALRLEPLKATKSAGVVAGLAGGCILALSKVQLGDSPTLWIILAMSSPVIIAIGNIYRTMRWPLGVAPMFLAAAMLLSGGLLSVPFALLQSTDSYTTLFASPERLGLLALQSGVFSLLYFLYFVLQRLAGPVYLSQIGSVAAVTGTAVAVWLLQEAVPPNLALATLFIVVAMALFQARGHRDSARSVTASCDREQTEPARSR